jgi:PAS domain S-box-containing protein
MRAPLQLSGSIRSKTRLAQWAHFSVLVALGGLLFLDSRDLLRNAHNNGAVSSQGVPDLQAHLNEISSALTTYLQNHDTASLERIKVEGREASRSMEDCKARLLQNGESDMGRRIDKDHQAMREATMGLLAADHDVVNIRQALTESNEALSSVLDSMQSSIRSDQLNASRRSRAVRMARAEAGNLPKDASSFNRAVNRYEDLSRTRRAERWADQARTFFREGLSRTNDLALAEGKRWEALEQYTEKKKALNKSLREVPTDLPPAKAGRTFMVLNGILILFGIILVLGSYHRADKDFARPLQTILQCVEAAAAGDTSRLPDHWSTDEVGQLSQATARLISVLARSENLIYHLAALVESSGDAIISHTLDGKILSWNKGAQRIYGYSSEEVKGQSIAILAPQDGGALMIQNLRRIAKGERLPSFETEHQARNGRSVQVLVRTAAIHDSTRKIIGASFVAQDLTGTDLLPSKKTEKNNAA